MHDKHKGTIKLANDFLSTFKWLQSKSNITFKTRSGTLLTATATIATKGNHKGEKVIRIYQSYKEFSRAYECCWGYYTNCNRTLLGMYSQSIDQCMLDNGGHDIQR